MLTFILSMSFTFAGATSLKSDTTTGEVEWRARNSKVICGGMIDGESLKFHVVAENEIVGGKSSDERILIYLDLHKPGQLHLLMTEAMSDGEYEHREAIVAQLSPPDAELIRALTPSRNFDLHIGFTDGLASYYMIAKKHTISVGCEEISNDSGLSLVR